MPVTSVIGFVNALVQSVVRAFREWVFGIPDVRCEISCVEGGLREAVWSLEPVGFGSNSNRFFV
ncbi:hypothetical protein C5D33_08440 [Rathayibacter toxicus]|nr:hypothetical protein C5D33_08440 [Rathayibacter toxicus]